MLKNGSFGSWDGQAPVGWALRSQRAEIAPVLSRKKRANGGAVAVFAPIPNGLSMGWLEQTVTMADKADDAGEQWLCFSCDVCLSGGQNWPENARILLEWSVPPNSGGGWRPGRRYAVPLSPADGSAGCYSAVLQFPVVPGAGTLTVKLAQYGGTTGSVAFSDVKLEAVPAPKPNVVRVASAYCMPEGKGDWQRNLAEIGKLVKAAAAKDCDLVLFGEGVSVVATGKSYVDVAQPIPGPQSNDLAALAKTHSIFVAAGLYERDGEAVYNTAVLFDRKGDLVGKYRKVHLPLSEVTGGLQPGTEFPVFDTELGRIGIQVCYDHHFPESARCLAAAGAEIILTPIWGDLRSDGECYDAVARSRALDNGVFYVMSVYSLARSLIVDPHGRILAATDGKKTPQLAIGDCDLRTLYLTDCPFRIPPNIQQGYRSERRPSAYGNLTRDQR